jgi:hypothetical protein
MYRNVKNIRKISPKHVLIFTQSNRIPLLASRAAGKKSFVSLSTEDTYKFMVNDSKIYEF